MALIANILLLTLLTIGLGDQILSNAERADQKQCLKRQIPKDPNDLDVSDNDPHIMCECNKDYCDNLVFDWPEDKNTLLQLQTSKAGKRFEQQTVRMTTRQALRDDRSDFLITIDPGQKYQEILGWGGAFTDATGLMLSKLNHSMDETLLDNYFGPTGLQYNLARVPISGTDFSSRPYSYDDSNGKPDLKLEDWNLVTEDTDLKIPYIKRAKKMVESQNNRKLKLFGSSWSPPPWMKTSNSVVRGHLIGPSSSNGTIYRAYANYLIKFLQEYEINGLPMWGMTVQNEAMTANEPTYDFNSLQMTSSEQHDFVKNHLGPVLAANGYDRDHFKLMLGDDNVYQTIDLIAKTMRDPEARKFVSGIAIHWYNNNVYTYPWIQFLYDMYGKQIEFLLSTEACNPIDKRPALWSEGVKYARDIIQDLERHVSGWVDWNMALDSEGGPNWVSNFNDSPVLVNLGHETYFKSPMYYALGHFTRFLTPGSRRIQSQVRRIPKSKLQSDDDLLVTATISEDDENQKRVSFVVLNQSEDSQTIKVKIANDQRACVIRMDPESISSFTFIV